MRNDLLSSFMNEFPLKESTSHPMNLPKANVVETDENFRIELSVPGFKKDSFEVKLEKNILIVNGNQKEEKTNKEKYTLREFSAKEFIRRFFIPKNINEESIHAKYEDGILSITLPKKVEEKQKPRAITIS